MLPLTHRLVATPRSTSLFSQDYQQGQQSSGTLPGLLLNASDAARFTTLGSQHTTVGSHNTPPASLLRALSGLQATAVTPSPVQHTSGVNQNNTQQLHSTPSQQQCQQQHVQHTIAGQPTLYLQLQSAQALRQLQHKHAYQQEQVNSWAKLNQADTSHVQDITTVIEQQRQGLRLLQQQEVQQLTQLVQRVCAQHQLVSQQHSLVLPAAQGIQPYQLMGATDVSITAFTMNSLQ